MNFYLKHLYPPPILASEGGRHYTSSEGATISSSRIFLLRYRFRGRLFHLSTVPSKHTAPKELGIKFPSLLPNSSKQISRPDLSTFKPSLSFPVCPRLDPWRADPRRRHTRATALTQLFTQHDKAHIAHLYYELV